MENIRFLGLIRDFIHVLVKDRVATEKNPLEYKFAPADNQGFWLQMLTKVSEYAKQATCTLFIRF